MRRVCITSELGTVWQISILVPKELEAHDFSRVSVHEQVVGSEETGEENKHCCYIFKIELFEKNGTLKKVLYDDTERYNRDMKGIE